MVVGGERCLLGEGEVAGLVEDGDIGVDAVEIELVAVRG